MSEHIQKGRRILLAGLVSATGLLALGRPARGAEEEPHFPGEPAAHNIVYQFNKADADYQSHVLFSVGEMVRKYGDNVHVVVTCFGPGIHILAKKPGRPVAEEIKQRVSSLAQYGVSFHACNNTLKSLKWTKDDIVDFAEIVPIGADDIMTLQEQGYAYLSW